MYNVRQREFTAPNGEKRIFSFRDGTNDEPTIIACFEEDYYKVMGSGLKPGDVVLDFGAHVGAVSLLAATIPGVRVIAVEVMPENCVILRNNIQLQNQEEQVFVYEKAIWHEPNQTIKINYAEDGTENGRVHNFVGSYSAKDSKLNFVMVPTITIPQIFEEHGITHCEFLKVDIEGAEEKLFTSLPLDILHKIKYITGEYHNNTFEKFFPFTEDYNITRKVEEMAFTCERKYARQ